MGVRVPWGRLSSHKASSGAGSQEEAAGVPPPYVGPDLPDPLPDVLGFSGG